MVNLYIIKANTLIKDETYVIGTSVYDVLTWFVDIHKLKLQDNNTFNIEIAINSHYTSVTEAAQKFLDVESALCVCKQKKSKEVTNEPKY